MGGWPWSEVQSRAAPAAAVFAVEHWEDVVQTDTDSVAVSRARSDTAELLTSRIVWGLVAHQERQKKKLSLLWEMLRTDCFGIQ